MSDVSLATTFRSAAMCAYQNSTANWQLWVVTAAVPVSMKYMNPTGPTQVRAVARLYNHKARLLTRHGPSDQGHPTPSCMASSNLACVFYQYAGRRPAKLPSVEPSPVSTSFFR